MCCYESFITCSSPSWPLMIQQNYFINACPHSRGPPCCRCLKRRVSLEMCPATRGASLPETQRMGIWGLKWNMQMWRDAAAEAWPQTEAADGGRAAGSRQRPQPLGAERHRGRSRCAESGSVPRCVSAPRRRCLLHVLPCSPGTLRTPSWPLLPAAEGGFAKQQAKGAGGESRRSASLPLLTSAELRQG